MTYRVRHVLSNILTMITLCISDCFSDIPPWNYGRGFVDLNHLRRSRGKLAEGQVKGFDVYEELLTSVLASLMV